MLHRRPILEIARRIVLVTFSTLMTVAPISVSAQGRSWDYETPASFSTESLLPKTNLAADASTPKLEANAIIGATLCFAVGFGACLAIVHYLLPSLVHAQCVEIVRDYMDHAKRESDIRVVFLDRDGHESLQRPRRVATSNARTLDELSDDPEHRLRLDQPSASASYSQHSTTTANDQDTPSSMLSKIYEQNLHLREQLRKQSRSVKQ